MLDLLGVPLDRTEVGSLVATLLVLGDERSHALAGRLAHAMVVDLPAMAVSHDESDVLFFAVPEAETPRLARLRGRVTDEVARRRGL